MRNHIEQKFNKNGFAIITSDLSGSYDRLIHGQPFTYQDFLHGLSKHDVFFDSGMYNGNNRNYSQWRSYPNKFWKDKLYPHNL